MPLNDAAELPEMGIETLSLCFAALKKRFEYLLWVKFGNQQQRHSYLSSFFIDIIYGTRKPAKYLARRPTPAIFVIINRILFVKQQLSIEVFLWIRYFANPRFSTEGELTLFYFSSERLSLSDSYSLRDRF